MDHVCFARRAVEAIPADARSDATLHSTDTIGAILGASTEPAIRRPGVRENARWTSA